jgi:hypothetical protein
MSSRQLIASAYPDSCTCSPIMKLCYDIWDTKVESYAEDLEKKKSTVMTYPSTMSVEITVFAAYAHSSGLATNDPATNAARTIPTFFALIMLWMHEMSYKTRYGIAARKILLSKNEPRPCEHLALTLTGIPSGISDTSN